ncbi:hypothetical protein [Streptomyces sp. NPDC056937]|uniref:hypothetical protein n=1 Tax=Streptomyces sp. NPDC056937 TaxID=3345969 RepID=UPI003625B4DE
MSQIIGRVSGSALRFPVDGEADLFKGLPPHDVEDVLVVEFAGGEVEHAVGVAGAPPNGGAPQIVYGMHFRNLESRPRIGWFFIARHWQGEPWNVEPHNCAGLS